MTHHIIALKPSYSRSMFFSQISAWDAHQTSSANLQPNKSASATHLQLARLHISPTKQCNPAAWHYSNNHQTMPDILDNTMQQTTYKFAKAWAYHHHIRRPPNPTLQPAIKALDHALSALYRQHLQNHHHHYIINAQAPQTTAEHNSHAVNPT